MRFLLDHYILLQKTCIYINTDLEKDKCWKAELADENWNYPNKACLFLLSESHIIPGHDWTWKLWISGMSPWSVTHCDSGCAGAFGASLFHFAVLHEVVYRFCEIKEPLLYMQTAPNYCFWFPQRAAWCRERFLSPDGSIFLYKGSAD